MSDIAASASFWARLLTNGATALAILVIPLMARHAMELLLHAVAPADFWSVPGVRRFSAAGGVLAGTGLVVATAWRDPLIGANLLAPAGARTADVLLFLDMLGATFAWLRPSMLAGAPPLIQAAFAAGLLLGAFGAVVALLSWPLREGLRASLAGALTWLSTAIALAYVFAASAWMLQLLNFWFVAIAGVVFQAYRNAQSTHHA